MICPLEQLPWNGAFMWVQTWFQVFFLKQFQFSVLFWALNKKQVRKLARSILNLQMLVGLELQTVL